MDVVEGKLNDVITKVRGSETEFINPLLRLGKKTQTTQILSKKHQSINLKQVSEPSKKKRKTLIYNLKLWRADYESV